MKNKKITELICSTQPFSVLSEKEAEELVSFSKTKTFLSGQTLGNSNGCVILIVSGKVTVTKQVGDKTLLMRMLGKGSLSGVASVFTDEPEEVSVLTATVKTEALFIPDEYLSLMIHQNGKFAENYIRFLTSRIRFLNARIKAYTSKSAEAKLAFHILWLCEDGSDMADIGCSLTKLADMLDMGRASLYRAIEDLSEKGLIIQSGRKIKILDRKNLEKM